MTTRILVGDCREKLAELEDKSVHSAITSPPYFGLRDYHSESKLWDAHPDCEHEWGETLPPFLPGPGNKNPTDMSGLNNPWRNDEIRVNNPHGGSFCQLCGAWRGALGLEPTPELYIDHMVQVFREVRRVLRDDGTLWLNIGDSYAGSGKGGNPKESPYQKQATNAGSLSWTGQTARDNALTNVTHDVKSRWKIKPKDRMMIPARLAIALQEDGWWLRDEIVWHKNGMPESVTDRCCRAHEMVYLLTKKKTYFYDHYAIMELGTYNGPWSPEGIKSPYRQGAHLQDKLEEGLPVTRVKRDVWKINIMPLPQAHFATFPPALVEPMVLAGTSQKGVCMACGAPWRRVVSKGGEPDLEHQQASGGDAKGEYHGEAVKDYEPTGAQDASVVKARILDGMRQRMTLGWYPTCRCDNADELPKPPKRPGYRANAEEKADWLRKCNEWNASVKAICETLSTTPVKPATVLDPFAGAFTTNLVADRLQRDSIAIELNPEYVVIGKARLEDDGMPLFNPIVEDKQEPSDIQMDLL